MTAGGWRRGSQTFGSRRRTGPASGASRSCVDGQAARTCTRPLQHLARRAMSDRGLERATADAASFVGDGAHTVAVRAFDASGELQPRGESAGAGRQHAAGAAARRRAASGRPVAAENDFTVRWANPTQPAAPIAAAQYRICPAPNGAADARCASTASQRGRDIQLDLGLTRAWTRRVASSASGSRTQPGTRTLSARHRSRVCGSTTDAPSLAFDEPARPIPLGLRVAASDPTSRLAEAWIEARRRGENAWRSLPTVSRVARRSPPCSTTSACPRVVYELRARARDLAGNERTIDRDADGSRGSSGRCRSASGRALRVGRPTRVRARGH